MIFTISDKDFFDKNKIKVIDGIAGAGKSSIIDKFFEDNGKKYGRYTSTNALKRDAQKRYPGTVCETVASGLFKTDAEHRAFYKEPREIEYEDIVIDEILQTSPKVIDYCKENRGFKNIIITTDTTQLLAPELGDVLIKKFMELKSDPNVIWITLTESKRPVNEVTTTYYNVAYKKAQTDPDGFSFYKDVKAHVKNAQFCDIKISNSDIILTHTKAIEEYIYKVVQPRETGFELIPKGTIARKQPKNLDVYPVISQSVAEEKKIKAYIQAKQICTPTRYQGSEALPGTNVYFMVEKNSKVSTREIYTVLTRCKDIHDLTIVTIDLPATGELKTYCGKPVKKHGYLTIDHDMPELDNALKAGYMDETKIKNIVSQHESKEISYDEYSLYYKGEQITTKENKERSENAKNKKQYTPSSIMKKEEKVHYSYVADIYRVLEANGVDRISCPAIRRDSIPGIPLSQELQKEIICTDPNNPPKYGYTKELDLYSAYATIMKNEEMPVDGFITYQKGIPGNLDFYICTEDCMIYKGHMFTNAFKEAISHGKYLFSLPCEKGLKPGIFLYDKAHHSKETKSQLKEFHWGYYQKKYLSPIYKGNEVEYYELNESFIYEILMVAILSVLSHITYNMLEAIGGGYPIVDAILFNEEILCRQFDAENPDTNKADTLINFMKENFPNYDFRLKDLLFETYDCKEEEWKTKIYFKNYPDLLTEKDLQKVRQREAMRKARAEGRVNDTRKNHHKKEVKV